MLGCGSALKILPGRIRLRSAAVITSQRVFYLDGWARLRARTVRRKCSFRHQMPSVGEQMDQNERSALR
jgi:hypothetical protein